MEKCWCGKDGVVPIYHDGTDEIAEYLCEDCYNQPIGWKKEE